MSPSASFTMTILWCLPILLGFVTSSVFAQALPVPPPVLDPSLKSGERPPAKEFQPPAPPSMILPPAPTVPEGERDKVAPSLRVFAKKIKVTGSTVLTEEELTTLTAPFENRELLSEDLEALRLALTVAYVNKGYVTSGAILPDQTVREGIITFQIVEGVLTRIEIEGADWFRPHYIRDRLERSAGPPINVAALQERLQLLQVDPRFQQINAELRPGLKLGESVLNVKVVETQPYHGWLEFNNFLSPAVGSERGLVTLQHQNLTGHADTLNFTYGKSGGVDPQFDTSYALPINTYDTTVIFQYRKNDFLVIDPAFTALEIKSESDIYGVTIRHPLYRTLNEEFALTLTGEHLFNQTFLLGTGFPLTGGSDPNGESRVSALRLGQEWVSRTSNQVFAVRSRFSMGVDVLEATKNVQVATDAHSRFFAWLGQIQWARRFGSMGIQVLSRGDLQVANTHLFPLEQTAVGGRFTVRGYRENTLVRDNAFTFSLESRVPVYRSAANEDIILLAPFIDVGRAWNSVAATPVPDTLASIGLGAIWNVMQGSRVEVYWGQPLNHVPTSGGNMQDAGVHFQAVWQVF